MMGPRVRSLQFRLAIRLALLYAAATAVALGVLVYRAYDTAGTLNDRELTLRAADLARAVKVDPAEATHLDLPAKLKAAYAAAPGTDIFAVRDSRGTILLAEPASFGKLVGKWPNATDDPGYFRIEDVGSGKRGYYGLGLAQNSAAGMLSVWVARAGTDALAESFLEDFAVDIAWLIPLLLLITLAIGVLAIRNGLKLLREVSELASTIGPATTSIRLPDEHLPSEISPLVSAMNHALDRLEQGFVAQQQFTANAAHELRTPLAIITGALDAMADDPEVAKLRGDVARMNRLVEQLLRVARLDAVALDVSGVVDLNEVAADVVTTMAPWAVAHERMVALDRPSPPVRVEGNAHALADAIRNLVDNAIAHTPAGTEVTVSTHPAGSVSVADCGCGVPEADRQHVFERFWRGRHVPAGGAGLGLSIVREIVKAHRGSVRIDDGPNGGAVFTLCFRLATAPPMSKLV